jgi:hypothetical protein
VTDVTLYRLLGEVEPIADLPVDESLGDESENFDLARGRGMFGSGRRCACGELDEFRDGSSASCDGLKALGMGPVSEKDFVSLSGVHGSGIGMAGTLL